MRLISTFFGTMALAGLSHAVTLHFDDVVTGTIGFVPAQHNGLSFANFAVVDPVARGYPLGWLNGLKSGNYVGFNYAANPASISSPIAPITGFRGYFTAAWTYGNKLTVTGTGPGFTQTREVLLYTSSPVLYGFDFDAPVTTIEFTSSSSHFVVDDLTIALVPEPGTMAALGAGALVILRRRRRM